MTHPNQNLAALIGSRICHDLISPIGAINNGLELLEMANLAAGPEMELISESCANANARIRFFRVAYGAASTDQMISMNEVRSILRDLSAGGRIKFDWRPDADLPRSEVQMAFLGLQCMETALHHGGTIGATFDNGRWRILPTDGTAVIDDNIWRHLTDPNVQDHVSAAHVQFALLATLAADAGRTPTCVGAPPDFSLVI